MPGLHLRHGSSIRASAERAKEARKESDRLTCVAWNQRMLGYRGPAQPSPALGDALNAGYRYLEVRALGCDTHQTVELDVVRRPKGRRSMSWSDTCGCKDCRSGVTRDNATSSFSRRVGHRKVTAKCSGKGPACGPASGDETPI
jgi:hypothetical protein